MSDQASVAYLSVDDVSRILSAVGGRPITVDMLKKDIEAGAPMNSEGRMNLAYYAAWMAKEMGRGD